MLNILVKFIFKIITKMFDVIFSPVFSAISALFPSLGSFFTNINNFLVIALEYVSAGCQFMLIPQTAMLLLFDYYIVKYSIYLIIQGIHFINKVYVTLKP